MGECAHTLAEARQRVLAELEILDTDPEPQFEAVVALLGDLFAVPVVLFSLHDGDRQWHKARIGMPDHEMRVQDSLCRHVIDADRNPVIVPDTRLDPRFRDNPNVTGPNGARFYAGTPVALSSGVEVGTLCVLDSEPREGFGEREGAQLAAAAALIAHLLEERLAARREHRSATRLEDFTSAASSIFWETDRDDRFSFLTFGSSVAEPDLAEAIRERMMGQTRAASAEADTMCEPWRSHVARIKARKPFRNFVYRKDLPDGETTVYLLVNGQPRYDEDGAFLGYRGVTQDVTAFEIARQRAERLANADTLTGIANRHCWHDALAALASQPDRTCALVVLDHDRFKDINDQLGHAAGDAVLTATADRLRANLRDGDLVARLGGDEFALLLNDLSTSEAVAPILDRLLGLLAAPVEFGGRSLHPRTSAGVAFWPADASDRQCAPEPEAVMLAADLALYSAKAHTPGGFVVYTPEMREAVEAERRLRQDLKRAVERGEFRLHYQPQIDLRTGRTAGFEALLRWQHPEDGLLAPGAFLPLLEESSLDETVGRWVVEEAARQAGAWRRDGQVLRMGINVSARMARSPALVALVGRVIEENDLEPWQIEIEVTERVVISGDPRVAGNMAALRDTGVSIAFDDFGTGYASLSTLRDFPLDRVKIDRSFVSDVGANPAAVAITRGLVSICRDLGLATTAEGVEDPRHEAFLQLHGCDEAQGYHYGRPAPPEDAIRICEPAPADGADQPRTLGFGVAG